MSEHSTIPSLVEYLQQIPEYRQARGRRHPLRALLLVCGPAWLRRLGFTRAQGPSQPTLSRLFQRIPYRTVEAALGRWAEQVPRCCPAAAGALEAIALDGKALRGSQRQGAVDAHPLSAFSHRLGVTLGQVGVPDKTNEIGAAGEFLLALALEGRLVTADALLTQRALARTILASGGDYLLAVKENQPTLHADIAATFAPAADATGLVGAACTVTQHGGRVECRRLVASTALVGYSDWPGLRQVLCLERRVLDKRTGGLLHAETASAVTSCAPQRAAPAQLLAVWRGHWSVENQLHSIRDVAFAEDHFSARAGHAPRSWPPSATPPSA